jgi:hypothetical protein
LAGAISAFLLGVLGKSVVGGGFLMVNLWWNRGRSWRFDGHYFGLKTRHVARIYFLEGSVSGIG